MAAYVIADIEVTDPEDYEGYKRAVAATIAAYGGRYLARGGHTDVLEGDWHPRRLVLLQFPSLSRAREWYGSVGYAPLLALRQRSARTNLVITDGI